MFARHNMVKVKAGTYRPMHMVLACFCMNSVLQLVISTIYLCHVIRFVLLIYP